MNKPLLFSSLSWVGKEKRITVLGCVRAKKIRYFKRFLAMELRGISVIMVLRLVFSLK